MNEKNIGGMGSPSRRSRGGRRTNASATDASRTGESTIDGEGAPPRSSVGGRTNKDSRHGGTPGASSSEGGRSNAASAGMAAAAAASTTIPRDGRQTRTPLTRGAPRDVAGGGPTNTSGGRHNNATSRSTRNRRRRQTSTASSSGGSSSAMTRTSSASSSAVDAGSYLPYPAYLPLEQCVERYQARDTCFIRGKLRATSRDGGAFVTCDRGSHDRDVFLPTPLERNRALDGDTVFVELDPHDDEQDDVEMTDSTAKDGEEGGDNEECESDEDALSSNRHESLGIDDGIDSDSGPTTWQDDEVQMKLWNPIVTGIRMRSAKRVPTAPTPNQCKQRTGRVVHVVLPKPIESELKLSGDPTMTRIPNRRLVGSIQKLASGTLLFNPQTRSLPQFKCPPHTQRLIDKLLEEEEEAERQRSEASDSEQAGAGAGATGGNPLDRIVFQAEYVPLSWKESQKWPPCCRVEKLGDALTLEHEIQALLIANDVDHGEFPPQVLQQVDQAVQSGIMRENDEIGWCPTPEMLEGRRDFRNERIFTIDPTTAKDLDDALHIKLLESDGNGRGIVEIGVHIADVSFFVTPGTAVDREAQRRTTTVYLVDRTVPMLPRPLCEIACSLNENVERLAFSCVWKMHLDGTLVPGSNNVWYGRSVIKSCARLDYSTAQNIIDGTVATGEATLNDELWPPARRPTSPHTVDEVAADVRLMHKVAMARRAIRFGNGALALHGTKLTFQLDTDGQSPLLVAPYPIRDSNRLVEEYMLLANYLVAQRLITHAKRLAVLRMHPEPLMDGLGSVVNVASAAGVTIDVESGQSLHRSLVRLSQQGDLLLLQCVTNLLMTPMQAAEYFVAGTRGDPEEWRHYALNIPYYTHFTSPIRRYPDVLVHRLLQATIDGPEAVAQFHMSEETMEELCVHSNEKRLASKGAQERCDCVYLSLFVRKNPLESQLGVVLSVGKSSFTVFLPGLGASAMVYLMEHKSMLTYASDEQADGKRRIVLQRKPAQSHSDWSTLEIEVLVKLSVTVVFKEQPPIDIKARLEGPWKG